MDDQHAQDIAISLRLIQSEFPTLRDRFALAALQALACDVDFGTVGKPYDPWPWTAEQAYKAADAMLRARTQPEAGNG